MHTIKNVSGKNEDGKDVTELSLAGKASKVLSQPTRESLMSKELNQTKEVISKVSVDLMNTQNSAINIGHTRNKDIHRIPSADNNHCKE